MSASSFLVLLVVMTAVVAFVSWRAGRQLTLFVIRASNGRISAVKGRMPQRLLSDITEVLTKERYQELRIRCHIDEGRACVTVYGDSNPGLEQVLRNLVGEYPLLRLKQSPPVRR